MTQRGVGDWGLITPALGFDMLQCFKKILILVGSLSMPQYALKDEAFIKGSSAAGGL